MQLSGGRTYQTEALRQEFACVVLLVLRGFFLGGGLLVFLEISEKINVTGVDFEGREI